MGVRKMCILYKPQFDNCQEVENRSYYNKIQSAPIYEKSLADGQNNRELMIVSHLRLVVKIARGFKSNTLTFSDMVSEGTIGLIEAVDRFDVSKGHSLATYATLWIKSAINAAILRNKSVVRMGTTASERKLFYNLSKLKDLDDETIAKKLSVSVKSVKTMRERLMGNDCSLNEKSGENIEFIDSIASDTINQEERLIEEDEHRYRHESLLKAMSNLNEREREIIKSRKIKTKPLSLETVSERFGISSERVRQIEKQALEKLKETVSE